MQSLQVWTTHSQCNSRTNSYLKQSSHSISFANPLQYHWYLHTNTSGEPLTIIKHPSDQWEAQYKCMRAGKTGAHGLNNQLMDGTWELPKSTINAKSVTSRKQEAKEYQTQCFSNTSTSHTTNTHSSWHNGHSNQQPYKCTERSKECTRDVTD